MSRLREHMRQMRDGVPELAPPQWVFDLTADATPKAEEAEQVMYETREGEDFALVSAHLAEARKLSRQDLAAAVYVAYSRIGEILAGSATRYPVRFWNHICHINEPMGGGMNRYMAFNAGRYEAFCEWVKEADALDRQVATATGVGCRGEDLVIHALAGREPGVAVANPRQMQSFRYSRKYGPKPPCFARATIVSMPRGARHLLIGGTASVRGEESTHAGDLRGQLEETFENLRALLGSASEASGLATTMGDVMDLRIYIPEKPMMREVLSAARAAIPRTLQVQFMAAEICRRELLVEIEGRAILREAAT